MGVMNKQTSKGQRFHSVEIRTFLCEINSSAILTDFKALNDLLVMKKKNLNLHTVKSLGGATTFPINSSL